MKAAAVSLLYVDPCAVSLEAWRRWKWDDQTAALRTNLGGANVLIAGEPTKSCRGSSLLSLPQYSTKDSKRPVLAECQTPRYPARTKFKPLPITRKK